MSRWMILVAPLALSACLGDGIKVETVPVPVAARCVDPAKIPVEPPLVDDLLTGNADADVNIIASSAKLLRAWGWQLTAIVNECAK